jgi:hypothetical protein
MSSTTEYGKVTARTWLSPSGLPVRTLVKLPFGEVEVKLATLK